MSDQKSGALKEEQECVEGVLLLISQHEELVISPAKLIPHSNEVVSYISKKIGDSGYYTLKKRFIQKVDKSKHDTKILI
jgi:hypothetical protein